MTDKLALRARLRAARDELGLTAAIPVALAFTERLASRPTIASYLPIGSEADPSAFVAAARDADCTLALPHVMTRVAPLRFLIWDDAVPLTAGPFGLRQPPALAAEVQPDVILTPLLGFDRRGNRLGQGAGHYDRAFAAHPDAWRIGIALSVQALDALIPDPWDVPLHAIATESDWIVP